MAIFGLKSYYFADNSKTTWRAQLKLRHNVDAYEWFTQTEFGGTRSRDQMLQAENEQKVDDFETIYLGNYRFLMKNDL